MVAWAMRVDDPPTLAQDVLRERPPPRASQAWGYAANPARRVQRVQLIIDPQLLDVVDIKTKIPQYRTGWVRTKGSALARVSHATRAGYLQALRRCAHAAPWRRGPCISTGGGA